MPGMAQKLLLGTVILLLLAIGAWGLAASRRAARFAEVPQNLRHLYEGATNYAQRYLTRPVKERIKPNFPLSSKITPESPCCLGGQPAACVPGGKTPTSYNPGEWKTSPFLELGFELRDPHLYRYSFTSFEPGEELGFEVSAHGDADCDGILSRFYRKGRVVGREVTGPLEIFTEHPEE
jgi:hypothetical protein